MKKLLLLLLLMACSKVERTQVPGSEEAKRYGNLLTRDARYSQSIDIMVAFLWPAEIRNESQRRSMRKIIRDSRELKSKKEEYLLMRQKLRNDFLTSQCGCVLEGSCSGDEELCLALESRIYENDRALVPIYELVASIKQNVKSMKGKWIETHVDRPELPPGSFDFYNGKIHFTHFEQAALSARARVTPEQDITITAPRKAGPGRWRIEVSPYKTSASLLIQGDLFLELPEQTLQGIIYWEHPLKDE